MPLGYVEYDEDLDNSLGRLGDHVEPQSRGYDVNSQGLGVRAGRDFLFSILVEKSPGQDGWLYLHNRDIPGLQTRLMITAPDLPDAGRQVIEPLFADFTRPVSLARFHRAGKLRINYSGKYQGPGGALVLNRIRIRWNRVQPAVPYLLVSLLTGAAAMLAIRSRPSSGGAICRLCMVVFVIQVTWGMAGWNPWVFACLSIAALILVARMPGVEKPRSVKAAG